MDSVKIIDNVNFFKSNQKAKKSVEETIIRSFPALWALKYKPIKSKPMTFVSNHNPFAHRPWQEAVLNDNHPNKVIQKARQLGMSELATAEVLWFADTHDNVNIMYTFPTMAQMADFSRTRVSPVIKDSPHLQRQVAKDLNNVSSKKIGTSNIFMRTSGDGSQGEGADIDMYCADEYDRMRLGTELAFKESMSSSKYGLMRRWSTPTLPGIGINELYEKSDQRRYLYKCKHCNTWQEITMDNIIQVKDGFNPITEEIEDGTYEYRCIKCRKPLDRWQVGKRIAKRPDVRDTRGYFISQLNALHISADSIMRRKLEYPFKQLFYNYVLGEPYANKGLEIQENDVKTHIVAAREEVNRTDEFIGYVAGIDWGEPTWVLVLGIRPNMTIQVVCMREFKRSNVMPLMDVKQVISLLKPFEPDYIIADAGYGADKNTELLRAFPYSAYACAWTTTTGPYSHINFTDHWNDKTRFVKVDKTSKMQRTIQAVKQGFIGFYSYQDEMTQMLTKHLMNVQILDRDKDGYIYQVATRKGADHLACCLAYALIGVDKHTQYGSKISKGYQMELMEL